MVAKQSIFLIVTLCALVYITFGTDVFDTSFTDEQYAALIMDKNSTWDQHCIALLLRTCKKLRISR